MNQDHELINRWSGAYCAFNRCDTAPTVERHNDGSFTIHGRAYLHPVANAGALLAMTERLEARLRVGIPCGITKWHLGHVKRQAARLLRFVPTGHNDGSTLFIVCRQDEALANALLRAVEIPGVKAEVKRYERHGSFAQKEQWSREGVLHDFYLCLYKGWDGRKREPSAH